jgi:hypothetical protein
MATAISFTNHGAFCPTCKRKFSARTGTDKKLAQDLARAESSLLTLRTYSADNEALREAIDLERQRLERALIDHSLLWSIYRRADKATGYGIALVRSGGAQ